MYVYVGREGLQTKKNRNQQKEINSYYFRTLSGSLFYKQEINKGSENYCFEIFMILI